LLRLEEDLKRGVAWCPAVICTGRMAALIFAWRSMSTTGRPTPV
jgi:hypothetical protein